MRVLYVTTTFPVLSESFLQREVRAMDELGIELEIVSLHRGDYAFDGIPVRRFEKWELLSLLYLLPIQLVSNWRRVRPILDAMFSRRPRYGLNLWENLLGFGAALALLGESRANRPDVIHCVWGSSPAAFGWLTSVLIDRPYSMGAHAYDVFEFGGDWLLPEKVDNAVLVHSSTESAAARVREVKPDADVAVIYRGLNKLPPFRLERSDNGGFRIICIARLVEKKGFPLQLKIYRALKDAGIEFKALIVGEGPLRESIEEGVKLLGLENSVTLLGRLSQEETLNQLAQSDVLFHTGVIAASGDRDGLPNVIPEAMAAGVIVVASPVSGVVEAIEDEVTGFLRAPENSTDWVSVCSRIQDDSSLTNQLKSNARNWVEMNFVARKNTSCLIDRIRKKIEV